MMQDDWGLPWRHEPKIKHKTEHFTQEIRKSIDKSFYRALTL